MKKKKVIPLLEWTRIAPMPTTREGVGVTGMDGILYAIGGGGVVGGNSNTAEAYII
eukprot:SAG31_NODE_2522_length_5565_cov_5.101903_1_plen_56_part_00